MRSALKHDVELSQSVQTCSGGRSRQACARKATSLSMPVVSSLKQELRPINTKACPVQTSIEWNGGHDAEWALHLGGSARLSAICASDAEAASLPASQTGTYPSRPADKASESCIIKSPPQTPPHVRRHPALSLKHTRTARSHPRYGPLRGAALTLHSTKSFPKGSI